MATILQAAYFGTLTPPPPRQSRTTTNRSINYYLPSYRSRNPVTSPPPSITEVTTETTNEEGERKMTVKEGMLFAIVLIILILVVTCMSISLIICLQDRASRSQIGEDVRKEFAVLKPTNCDTKTIGRLKYGNDTSMMWNELGWNVYPLIGICPAAGIVIDSFSYNYHGCIDFANTMLWQELDRQNAVAGTTTNLASAANVLASGTYRGCLLAGTIIIWISSVIILCTTNDPYLIAGLPLQTRCITVIVGFFLPFLLAFALFLQAFNVLISSEILKTSSYINSLFFSCSVSIKYTGTTTYQQFISLITILAILTFVFPIVLIFVLPKLSTPSTSASSTSSFGLPITSSSPDELTDPPTGAFSTLEMGFPRTSATTTAATTTAADNRIGVGMSTRPPAAVSL